jgi:hypothetical protein
MIAVTGMIRKKIRLHAQPFCMPTRKNRATAKGSVGLWSRDGSAPASPISGVPGRTYSGDVERERHLALARFFDGDPPGLGLFDLVAGCISALGPSEMRISKSQVAFRRHRGFAFVWRPDRYVETSAPAVLSIALPRRLASNRFKQVVQPSPGVWMHHLELHDVTDVDEEVREWLSEAHANAG